MLVAASEISDVCFRAKHGSGTWCILRSCMSIDMVARKH